MAKLKELLGIVKDKASQGRAAILSNRRITLSLLRATTHDSSSPPRPTRLSALLSSADGPRASASSAVDLLLRRLRSTHNSAVALKCLIAAHHVIRRGNFILRDQLSAAYPYIRGGTNCLNLSHFRDNTTPTSWELSSWVRWYAHHIENILCASRTLGFFLGSSASSSSPGRESGEERVSGLTNGDLLREIDSLVETIEGVGKRPNPTRNKLVDEVVGLAEEDGVVAMSEVLVRVNEFRERNRIGCLSFGEGVELVCAMKRLEECRESVMLVVGEAKRFWESVRELKEEAGKLCREEKGKKVTRFRATESDRFAGRVLNSIDLVRFPSARLILP